MALTFASGSRAVAPSTASDAVHNAIHGAFMTLPTYSRSREGQGHEPGFGVSNGSSTARSRPVEASRERMEREGPDPSAQGTAGSRIPWETPIELPFHSISLAQRTVFRSAQK